MEDTKTVSKIITKLFDEAKWAEARKYIEGLLNERPDDHWLLTRLGTTYYEEKAYSKALECIGRAFELAPYCPLVLWDYAGSLEMLQRNEEAIKIYKRLIRKGALRLSHEACGESIRWARSLVNDCYYRLGLVYAEKGATHLARKYVEMHINNRSRKCPSIYRLNEVKQEYKRIKV